MAQSGMVAIVGSAELDGLAFEVAQGLGQPQPTLIHGTLNESAAAMRSLGANPRYLVMDVGDNRETAIAEIEIIAQLCEPGTRVVAIGNINDIQFYRDLTESGVPDYFPLPAKASDIVAAFKRQDTPAAGAAAAPITRNASVAGEVIAFMSAAGGDGASTAALNAAFSIAQQSGKPTLLVDLDYQYGMAARNLNLATQYGIKDLFEHPDRGVDSTIVQRMVAHYGPLHVIAAPNELRYLPYIDATAVSQLIQVLKLSYDTIILDLPHSWQPWVAAACRESTSFVLVAQLWLKSVTHAARILRASRSENVIGNNVRLVINRAGAKFREAIETRDFERVTGLQIAHTLVNDIKTVVDAENQAKTIIEAGMNSRLKFDLENLARLLKNQPLESPDQLGADTHKGGLGQLLKRISS